MKNKSITKIVSALTFVMIIGVLLVILLLNSNGGVKADTNRSALTISKSSTITIYVSGVGVDLVSTDSFKDEYSIEQGSTVVIQAVNESHIFEAWSIKDSNGDDKTSSLLGTTISNSKDSFTMPAYDIEVSCSRREAVTADYGKYMRDRFIITTVDELVALQNILASYSDVSAVTDTIIASYDKFFGNVEEYKNNKVAFINKQNLVNNVDDGTSKAYYRLQNGYFLIANNLSVFSDQFYGIGTEDHPFNGIMCGNSTGEYSQVVLVITDADDKTNAYGLFAYLGSNAVVRNLRVRSSIGVTSTKTSGDIYAGGLAAIANNSLLVDLDVTGNINVSSENNVNVYAGGFIGQSNETSVDDISNLLSGRDNGSVIVSTLGNSYSGYFAGYGLDSYVKELDLNISGLNMTTRNTGSNGTNIYSGIVFGYLQNTKRIVLEDIDLTSAINFKVDNFVNDENCYTGGITGYVNGGASIELGSICINNKAVASSIIRGNTQNNASTGNVYTAGLFAYISGTNVIANNSFKNRIKVIEVDGKDAYVYNPIFSGNIIVEGIQNGKADGSTYGKVISGGIVGKGFIDINGAATNEYADDETHLVLSKVGTLDIKATQSSLATHVNGNIGPNDREHCLVGMLFGIVSNEYFNREFKNISVYAEKVNSIATREIGSLGVGDIQNGCFVSYSNGTAYTNINMYLNECSIKTDSLSYAASINYNTGDAVDDIYQSDSNSAYTGALAGRITNGYIRSSDTISYNSTLVVDGIALKGVEWDDLSVVTGTKCKISGIQNTIPGKDTSDSSKIKSKDYLGENYVGGIIGQIYRTDVKNVLFIGSETEDDYVRMAGHESPDSAFCGGVIGFIKSSFNAPSNSVTIENCQIQNVTVLGEATIEGSTIENPDIYIGGIVGAIYVHDSGGDTDFKFNDNAIINSSIKAVGNQGAISVYCGGHLAGVTWSSSSNISFDNCYTLDSTIDGKGVNSSGAVKAGGINGMEFSVSATYDNCAVIDSTIISSKEAGGLCASANGSNEYNNNYSNAVLKGATNNGIANTGSSTGSSNNYYIDHDNSYNNAIGTELSFNKQLVNTVGDQIFNTFNWSLDYLNFVLSYESGYLTGVESYDITTYDYRLYVSENYYNGLDEYSTADLYVQTGDGQYIKAYRENPNDGNSYLSLTINGETRYIRDLINSNSYNNLNTYNSEYYNGSYTRNGTTYYLPVFLDYEDSTNGFDTEYNNTGYYYNPDIYKTNRNDINNNRSTITATIDNQDYTLYINRNNETIVSLRTTTNPANTSWYGKNDYTQITINGTSYYYLTDSKDEINIISSAEYQNIVETESSSDFKSNYFVESNTYYKSVTEEVYNNTEISGNIINKEIIESTNTVNGLDKNSVSFVGNSNLYYEDVLNVWVNFKGQGQTYPLDLSKSKEKLASEGWFNMGEKIIYNKDGSLNDDSYIQDEEVLYGYNNTESTTSRENRSGTYEYVETVDTNEITYSYDIYVHETIAYYKLKFYAQTTTNFYPTFSNSLVGYGTYEFTSSEITKDGTQMKEYVFILYPNAEISSDYSTVLSFVDSSGYKDEHTFTFNFKQNKLNLVGVTYASYTPPLNYYEIENNNATTYSLSAGSITKFIPIVTKQNDIKVEGYTEVDYYYIDEKYIELIDYGTTSGTIKSSGELTAPSYGSGTVTLKAKSNSILTGNDQSISFTVYTDYTVTYSVIGMTTDCIPYASASTNYYFPIYVDNGYAGNPDSAEITIDGTKKTISEWGDAISLYSDEKATSLTTFNDESTYYLLVINSGNITGNVVIEIKFPIIYTVTFDLQCGSFNPDCTEMTKVFKLRNTQTFADFFGYTEKAYALYKTQAEYDALAATDKINYLTITIDGVKYYYLTDTTNHITYTEYEELAKGDKESYICYNETLYIQLNNWVNENRLFGYVFTGFYLVDNANDEPSYGEGLEEILDISGFKLNTSLTFYARWSFLIELVEAPGTLIKTSFADSFMYQFYDSDLVNRTVKVPINNNRGYVFSIEKDANYLGEAGVKAYIVTETGDLQVLTEIVVEKYYEDMYLYFIPPEQINGYLMLVTSISNAGLIVGENTATVTEEILPEDGIMTFKYVANHRYTEDEISYIYNSGDSSNTLSNLTLNKEFVLKFFKQVYTSSTDVEARTLAVGTVVEVYYQKVVNGSIDKRIVGRKIIEGTNVSSLLLSEFTLIEGTSLAFPEETFNEFLGNVVQGEDRYVSEVYYFVVTPPNGLEGNAQDQIYNYSIEGGYIDGDSNYVEGVRSTHDFVNIPIDDWTQVQKESSKQVKIYSVTPSRETTLTYDNTSGNYKFTDKTTYEIFRINTTAAGIDNGKLVLLDTVGYDTIIQSQALPFGILTMKLTLGYNTGYVNVYAKEAETDTWVVVGTINVTDMQYQTYTVNFPVGEYKYFKIDNISGKEIRVQDLTVVSNDTAMTYTIDSFAFETGTTEIVFKGDVINDVRHDGKQFLLAVQLKKDGVIVDNLPDGLTIKVMGLANNTSAIEATYTNGTVTSNQQGRVTAYFNLSECLVGLNADNMTFVINIPDGYTLHAVQLLEAENVNKPAMSEVRETIVK